MSGRKQSQPARVILTERAIADLVEIDEYSLEQWGPKAAGAYLDDIAAALDRLSKNPGLLHLEPEFGAGLYFYRVRKHVLVCDFREARVLVLTLIHTSINLSARLAELEPRMIAEVRLLHEQLDRSGH